MDVASATKGDLNELGTRPDGRIEEVEARLAQRIELSEERLEQKTEQVHSNVTRTVVSSMAAAGAVLAVVIPLAIYLIG